MELLKETLRLSWQAAYNVNGSRISTQLFPKTLLAYRFRPKIRSLRKRVALDKLALTDVSPCTSPKARISYTA